MLAAESGGLERRAMVTVFIVTPRAVGVTCWFFCLCLHRYKTQSALQVNLLTTGKGNMKSPAY